MISYDTMLVLAPTAVKIGVAAALVLLTYLLYIERTLIPFFKYSDERKFPVASSIAVVLVWVIFFLCCNYEQAYRPQAVDNSEFKRVRQYPYNVRVEQTPIVRIPVVSIEEKARRAYNELSQDNRKVVSDFDRNVPTVKNDD